MKVEVKQLRKYFGKTHAVKDISFSFESGEIYGFIGPNGAGKTTTMRILATLDEPTSGDASINDISIIDYPEKARKLFGYMPDALPTHKEMTVREYLDFFARAYRLPRKTRIKVLQSIEEFTRLTGISHKLLPDLSKGMKQRVSLARALVHDPPVLIMDEPAAGLDPRARVELRELLKALSAQGKAVLISSHILTELAEICTGAAIIEQGKLIMAGTMEDLIDQAENYQTTTRRMRPQDVLKQVITIRPLENTEELCREVMQMPHIEEARVAGKQVIAELKGGETECSELLTALITKGMRIVEFKQQRAGLEDIFMKVTRGEVQ